MDDERGGDLEISGQIEYSKCSGDQLAEDLHN